MARSLAFIQFSFYWFVLITMSLSETQADDKPRYRIGAVANLTGLSVSSIRAWERRYDLNIAWRSSKGTRFYTEGDVRLLSLLKALTDNGEAISKIAHLPEADLRARLKQYARAAGVAADFSPAAMNGALHALPVLKALVLSKSLAMHIKNEVPPSHRWRVCREVDSLDELWAQASRTTPDFLIARLEDLGSDPAGFLDRWNQLTHHALLILCYSFSPAAQLSALADKGARLVKWPSETARMLSLIPEFFIFNQFHIAAQGEATGETFPESNAALERIFSDEQLLQLKARHSSIHCECPHHLAYLLFELNDFEHYSRHCANRDAEDAALHARLASTTAQARAMVEGMLSQVCAHEQIKI